jgi:hypothetical protein
MRRILFTALLFSFSLAYSSAQSLDWNLRAGINIMDAKTSGKDISVLFHAGAQAGVRITNFGFYGELLYSMNENQYPGDPVSYFIPSIVMKGYMRRLVFAEMGAGVLLKAGDSGVTDDTLNPDKSFNPFAGMGVTFSKFEISFRANLKQSYTIMNVTAAVKF